MTRRGEPVLFGEPGSPEQLAEVSRLTVLAIGSVGLLGLTSSGLVLVHGRAPEGYHPLALVVLAAFAILVAAVGWHRRTIFSPATMPYILVVAALATAGGAFLSGPVFGPLVTMCFLWYGSTITYLPRRVAVLLMAWAALVCAGVVALQRGNSNAFLRWEMTVAMMAAVALQWNLLVERSWTLTRGAQAAREDAERARAELEIVSDQKSRFLARMSHELRTPLNAIIGFSEVLSRRSFGELNPKQAEYVDDIVDSGQHLLALVDDLLDLTKIETGTLTVDAAPLDLGELLSGSVALFKEQANRNQVRLTLQLLDRSPRIEADARKLKQVLFNLVANAVRFTPAGGSVTVATADSEERVLISVTDTGPGIAPGNREAIFEEYRQGAPAGGTRGGTGLGLPLARRLVEAHGGRLWVESTAGQGSTFNVELPLRPVVRAVRDEERPRPARRERRVLGVADSPEGRAVAARVYATTALPMTIAGTIFIAGSHFHPVAGLTFDQDRLLVILAVALVPILLFLVKPQWVGSPAVLPPLTAAIILLIHVAIVMSGPTFGDYIFLAFVTGVGALLLFTPRQRTLLLLLMATCHGATLALQDGYPAPVAHWVLAVGFLTMTMVIFGQFMARIEAQADAERVARAQAERVRTDLELAGRHKIEFLANMSHELRTPLNVIIGFSEVLDSAAFGPLNEKQTEYVRDVLSSGRHLLVLINDILDLAKIDAGRMELWCSELDLEAVVAGALRPYREAAARRHIELIADCGPGEPIEADEAKLAQAIGHLVSNALKFTPDGGEVTLRARRWGGDVEISVSDTGRGIDVLDQQRIFDAFALGDAQTGQGTGLGLALARRYAELHHGKLDVTSEVGMGATFVLRFPARRSTTPETAAIEVG